MEAQRAHNYSRMLLVEGLGKICLCHGRAARVAAWGCNARHRSQTHTGLALVCLEILAKGKEMNASGCCREGKKSFNTLFYTEVGNYFFSLLAQNRWPRDASKVDSHLNESWVHTKRAEFYYIESGLQVQSFDVIR